MSISKTSVAILPETHNIEILNMCISGQTAEAHEKTLICQVKYGSKTRSVYFLLSLISSPLLPLE